MKIPTYFLNYPEALLVRERLASRLGVAAAGVFDSLGRNPVTAQMTPHDVPDRPFLVINGSGNYHHETVRLVEGFLAKRPSERITYIQIDAHPDKTERFRWKCECGTFVGRILVHPQVDNIHLLGLNLPCLLEGDETELYTRHLSYYGENYFQKMHQYVAAGTDLREVFWHFEPVDHDQARTNPSVAHVSTSERPVPPQRANTPAKLRDETPHPALEVLWRGLDSFDATKLPPYPVYLSIDLDVSREIPITDWRERFVRADNRLGVVDNEGIMEWADVMRLVHQIGASRTIAAADICGLTEHFHALSDEALEESLVAVDEVVAALNTYLTSAELGQARS